MNWVFYSSIADHSSETLECFLRVVSHPENVDKECSLESFSRRLRHPVPQTTHALLIVSSLKEMEELLKYRAWMMDWRLILGLTPANNGIASLAHRFHPRFVAYLPEHLNQIQVFISKMVTREKWLVSRALTTANPNEVTSPLPIA